MSDSLPPVLGSVPAEEHDLDALLSGGTVRVLGPLRPVAGVMAALRAAPGSGELDGEASARAAFRMFMLSEAGDTAASGRAATSPMPPLAADGVLRVRARSGRPPRHARQRSRRPVAGLLGVAAAVAGVIAITCALTGPWGNSGPPAGNAANTPAVTASSSAYQQGLEGGAKKEPTPHPAPTVSVTTRSAAAPGSSQVPGPEALCREYLDNLRTPANPPAVRTAIKQLGLLAGGRQRIGAYCAGLNDGQSWSFWPGLPAAGPGSPSALPGLPGGHNGLGPDQGRAAASAHGQL
jgi:hypothetical protein